MYNINEKNEQHAKDAENKKINSDLNNNNNNQAWTPY